MGDSNDPPRVPRVGVCGFSLESHRWAKPCGEEDFKAYSWWVGESITEDVRKPFPAIKGGCVGFFKAMDEEYTVDGWKPCPAMIISTCPAGPVEAEFFRAHLDEVEGMLRAAMPLDGVYICQHGGSCGEHTDDTDGDYYEMVRGVVGPHVPIISTLDLHSNISDKMVSSVDAMIGYITYPHVDAEERGMEAGHAMKEMIDGMRTSVAHIRLPLVPPLVTQFTFEDGRTKVPYGDLIRLGQSKLDEDVLNITILSGFDFSDTDKNGLTILVYTRGKDKQRKADQICRELAIAGWDDRAAYSERLSDFLTLEEATARAKAAGDDTSLPPLLFADIADNPGGGARSNTTYILKAFIDAGVKGAIIALFFDPVAVEACISVGVGAEVALTLNEKEYDPQSHKLDVKGIVAAISDGKFNGSTGMTKGKSCDVGASAALTIGGVTLIINSKRTQVPPIIDSKGIIHFLRIFTKLTVCLCFFILSTKQCLSADQITFIGGLDPAAARCVVVKSTVHYRAGFPSFSPGQILEVSAPGGLTTPDHTKLAWERLPRPVYPLDGEKAMWTPPPMG